MVNRFMAKISKITDYHSNDEVKLDKSRNDHHEKCKCVMGDR